MRIKIFMNAPFDGEPLEDRVNKWLTDAEGMYHIVDVKVTSCGMANSYIPTMLVTVLYEVSRREKVYGGNE